MDKLNALKYFCTAADTLQFRETAQRLSVSPQVVTRVIAELEDYLGETLFVRNTRNVQLTDFGARFLPEAQQPRRERAAFHRRAHPHPADEMRGTVRITLPFLPENDAIIAALFARCAEYPDLQPDWRVNAARLNNVENQIDIGLRIGSEPRNSSTPRPPMRKSSPS
ncbi:LysR family transcriptional regulator [Cardiobacterium valvarum]|uniref:LysR family transcriptional regulator n=1 Tax=Cardiobacterium valvarum TaxID=194702 RepID=UPI0035EFAB80